MDRYVPENKPRIAEIRGFFALFGGFLYHAINEERREKTMSTADTGEAIQQISCTTGLNFKGNEKANANALFMAGRINHHRTNSTTASPFQGINFSQMKVNTWSYNATNAPVSLARDLLQNADRTLVPMYDEHGELRYEYAN
jgi:hypothetical protein